MLPLELGGLVEEGRGQYTIGCFHNCEALGSTFVAESAPSLLDMPRVGPAPRPMHQHVMMPVAWGGRADTERSQHAMARFGGCGALVDMPSGGPARKPMHQHVMMSVA